nr:MAG TPA: hypothetical protein [Caudoviricetes sp.]
MPLTLTYSFILYTLYHTPTNLSTVNLHKFPLIFLYKMLHLPL